MQVDKEERCIGEWTRSWLESAGISHEYLTSCDSTSGLARKLGFRAPPIHVIVADHQTSGRGRGHNTWVTSEPGTALLATWSVALKEAPQHLTSPLVGLALYDSLRTTWPEFLWSVKPPNDIYLGPHKVAGLLLEVLSQAPDYRLLVGLGLNVIDRPAWVENSTYLEGPHGTDGERITKKSWWQFLETWHQFLQNSLTDLTLQEFTLPQTEHLLHALKSHPILGPKIQAIESQGNIVYSDKVVSWQNL